MMSKGTPWFSPEEWDNIPQEKRDEMWSDLLERTIKSAESVAAQRDEALTQRDVLFNKLQVTDKLLRESRETMKGLLKVHRMLLASYKKLREGEVITSSNDEKCPIGNHCSTHCPNKFEFTKVDD